MAFKGFHSILWQVLQKEHFKELNSRRSGCCLISSLIQKLWDAAWSVWQHRNFVLKNKTHEIESYADLMAKLQTRIIYHRHIGLRGLPETHLSLFEQSANQIRARTPCNQIAWLKTVATGRLMINRANSRTPIPQDKDLKLVDQLGKSGLLRNMIKAEKAPAYITKATPPRRNLLTVCRNPRD